MRAMQALSNWLDRKFLWLLLTVYGLAALLPSPGRWLRDLPLGEWPLLGETLRLNLPMLLLAALLGNAGLMIPAEKLGRLLRRPSVLAAGLVANLVVPLAFILGVAQVMNRWHEPTEAQAILIGLGLIAAMPIAGSATAWTRKANGNLALSLGLVLASTLLSPLTTPSILAAVAWLTGEPGAGLQDVSGLSTSAFLFLCVLLPSLLGILALRLLGTERVAPVTPALKLGNSLVLLVLIYLNAAASFGPMLMRLELDFALAMFGVAVSFCVVAFAAGWLVARLLGAGEDKQTSLMFGLGMANNGTGMVLASVTLAGQPQVLLLIVCYNLVQHLVAGGVDYLRIHYPELFASTSGGGERLSWRLALRPFLSFGFLLLAGVIVATACATYWNIRTLAATNRWVVHTHQVLTQIQGTLSLLKDAETGQRGYLITGNPRYLQPYDNASVAVNQRLQRLKKLTGDNPGQRDRVATLEGMVGERFSELGLTIHLYKKEGFEAARRVVLEDRGRRNMDDIRLLMAEMAHEEEQLLEQRTAAADLRVRRALATVVLLAVLLLAYICVRRWIRGYPGTAGSQTPAEGDHGALTPVTPRPPVLKLPSVVPWFSDRATKEGEKQTRPIK